ncbi:MAG: PAS domain S-box protein [Magnetococcus sp. YQC-5]
MLKNLKNLPFKKKIRLFLFLIVAIVLTNAMEAVMNYRAYQSVWNQEHLTRKVSSLIHKVERETDTANQEIEYYLRTKDFNVAVQIVALLEGIAPQVQALEQLRVMPGDVTGEHLTTQIASQLKIFKQIQQKSLNIGVNENSGEQGRIREEIRYVEAKLIAKQQCELLTGLLQMRRHEKDLLARQAAIYLQKFNAELERFEAALDISYLEVEEKREIRDALSKYSQGVSWLSSELLEMEKGIKAYRIGIFQVDAAVEELRTALENVYKTHDEKQSKLIFGQFVLSNATNFIVLLLIGLFLLWFQLDLLKAIHVLNMGAVKVAAGEDHEIVVDRGDEIGQLALYLKIMKVSLTERNQELTVKLSELEASEKKYSSVIQLAGDPIVSLNEVLQIFAWNQGAENCFGLNEREIQGQSVFSVVALPNHLQLKQVIQKLRHDKKTLILGEEGHFFCKRGDGELFPVTLSLSTWEMDAKPYYTLIVRDISEPIARARQIERALDLRSAVSEILQHALESWTLQEILARALERVLSVSWLGLEQRGAIFLFDEQTEQLELVVQQALHPELVKRCKQVPLGHCLCGRAAASKEVVMSSAVDDRHDTRFDGMTPHGHYCIPILSNQNRLGVLNVYLEAGHVFDDEEVFFLKNIANTLAGLIFRRRAEQKITQLSRALDQSPVAVVITDAEGLVEYVNPRFSSLTGFALEEVAGQDVIALKTTQDSPEQLALENVLTLGGEWSGEVHSRKKSGELFWEFVSFSSVLDMDQQVINHVLIGENITEKKELESVRDQLLTTLDAKVVERTQELKHKIMELETTRHELIESEKMASLGRLVAGIAHEVNTPIGVAFSASSQLLDESNAIAAMVAQEEVDVDELMLSVGIMQEASKLVVRNLQRAAELIQGFKRASIDQSSEAEREFFISEVIHDVQLSLRNIFKKTSITVNVACPEDLRVIGTPGYLNQILTNLLLNSLTHGFAGGTLPGTIDMNFVRDGSVLYFEYIDSGQGMSAETKQKAFEPFFTTNRGAGGSGLGLYVIYNLITNQLRGSVHLTSVQGQGVRFECRWPIVLKTL